MYSLEEIKQFYYEEMDKRELTTIDAICNKYVFDEIQKLEHRNFNDVHDIINNTYSFIKNFVCEATDEMLQWICETPNYRLTTQIFELKNERLAKQYFAQWNGE